MGGLRTSFWHAVMHRVSSPGGRVAQPNTQNASSAAHAVRQEAVVWAGVALTKPLHLAGGGGRGGRGVRQKAKRCAGVALTKPSHRHQRVLNIGRARAIALYYSILL